MVLSALLVLRGHQVSKDLWVLLVLGATQALQVSLDHKALRARKEPLASSALQVYKAQWGKRAIKVRRVSQAQQVDHQDRQSHQEV